mgnify:CR=1 FL=1
MLNTLSPLDIASALTIMTVAATVQCSLGFGAALIALPVLGLISPVFAPSPLIMTAIVMGLLILLRDHSALGVREMLYAWPGQLGGIVVALLFFQWFSSDYTDALLGTALLVAVGLSSQGFHVAITRKSLLATGVVSGFMGTISGLGGAPMGILYQKESGPHVRTTMACLLLSGSISITAALWWSGRIQREEWEATLLLLPASLLGFVLSWPLARFLDSGYTRRAILLFAGLGGIVLLGRGFWS